MISRPWVGKELEDTRELMGDNYWPYGIDANRKVLEALFQYSYEQGLASCQLTIEELFRPQRPARRTPDCIELHEQRAQRECEWKGGGTGW